MLVQLVVFTSIFTRSGDSHLIAICSRHAGGHMRIAIATMAHDEALFLPIWLRHHARLLGSSRDLFVIDHGTRDGSTDGLDCSLLRLPSSPPDDELRARAISRIVAGLLEWYDWVAFCDTDELLLPDPHEDSEGLEAVLPGEPPATYVRRVTALKLDAAVDRLRRRGLPMAPVLCSDTTVALGRTIYGKPADARDAARMLHELAGTTHRVLTAVAVQSGRKRLQALNESRVTFAPLTTAQVRAYVDSGEPMGKAGAYAVQGAAARMMRPAVYSFASSGEIQRAKMCCMNSQPRNAMLNGFTSQLMKRVTASPFGFLATPPMALKSTLSIMG